MWIGCMILLNKAWANLFNHSDLFGVHWVFGSRVSGPGRGLIRSVSNDHLPNSLEAEPQKLELSQGRTRLIRPTHWIWGVNLKVCSWGGHYNIYIYIFRPVVCGHTNQNPREHHTARSRVTMESLKSRQYGSTSGLRLRFEGIDGDWRCDMPWLYCSEYILVQWHSYQKSKLNKGRVWDSKVIDILTSRYESIGLTRSTAQSNLCQSSFHPSCKPVVRQPLMLSLQLACVQKRHCKLTMLHPESVFVHFCKLQSLAQQTLRCRQVVGGACGHLGKRRKPWAGAADLGRRHRRTYSMPSCQIAWVCKIERFVRWDQHSDLFSHFILWWCLIHLMTQGKPLHTFAMLQIWKMSELLQSLVVAGDPLVDAQLLLSEAMEQT